jgi:FecR protein
MEPVMKPLQRLLALLIVLASGAAAAADVGRVVLAAGETSALRQGQVVRLALGTLVQDQDVLRTGAASNLQVRFEDDSYVSLREGSELRVDQFKFGGVGEESAVFSLLKGGLRAVTGLVGRSNHDDYKMVTPTATIGIRGTDYAATLCQGDCKNPDGSPAKDGLYGRVIGQSRGTNQINVSNDAGQRTLGVNSNFFVGDRKGSIELLLVAPEFVLSKLESRNRGGSKGESGGTGSERASSGGASDESRPSTTPDPLPQLAFVATNSLNSQGTPAALQPANGFLIAFPGTTGMFGDAFFDDDDQTIGTFNSQNQLIAASGDGRTASLAGGSIVDAGSFTLGNQTFVWGRWTGATSVPLYNGSAYVQTTGVPLLFGTATGVEKHGSVVGMLGGVATYSYVGGPRPVDGGGNVGNMTSTSTTINFTTLQQTLSLGMSFPSILVGSTNTGPAVFSLTGTGGASTGGQSGEFAGNLTGSCSGSGCLTSSPTGFFSTGLTGPNGYELAPTTGLVNGTQAGEVAFLNLYQSSSFIPGAPPSAQQTGVIAFGNSAPSVANVANLNPNQTVVSGNSLISFGDGTTFPSGMLNTGSIVETGSVALVDGSTMNWGRWNGPGVQVISAPGNVPINPSTGVPYVLGSANPVLPTSGTFLYSFAGGPNPVTTSGTTGTFTAGSFNVSFGSTSGSMSVVAPLTLAVGGVSYFLSSCASGCTFTNSSGVAGNMVLNGICSGGACATSTPATSNAAGTFVGPQAGGLAVSGQVFSSAPTVTFAAGFKR